MSLAFEDAYQSVLSYGTPQLRETLERELPRIRGSIQREADKFADELGKYIQAELKSLEADLKTSRDNLRSKLDGALAKMEDASGMKIAEAREQFEALKADLDQHEARWTKAGEGLRKTAVAAGKKLLTGGVA